MATLTSRLGLTKPATTEDYSVGVFNANADLLDVAVGVTPATSTTRPSTQLFEGRAVHESDTGQLAVRRGAAWSLLGLATAVADSLARRTTNGRLKVGAATEADDAVQLSQVSGVWVTDVATSNAYDSNDFGAAYATVTDGATPLSVTFSVPAGRGVTVEFSAPQITLPAAVTGDLQIIATPAGGSAVQIAAGRHSTGAGTSLFLPSQLSGSFSNTTAAAVNYTIEVQGKATGGVVDVRGAGLGPVTLKHRVG